MKEEQQAWDWAPVSRKPTAKQAQERRLNRVARSVEHLIRAIRGVNGRPVTADILDVMVKPRGA